MSRTHQELLALKSVLDGFKEHTCKDQECADCPINTNVCMAIADPESLVEVMRIEYLKKTGFWNVTFDWLKERVR